jgi:hypothetical protein
MKPFGRALQRSPVEGQLDALEIREKSHQNLTKRGRLVGLSWRPKGLDIVNALRFLSLLGFSLFLASETFMHEQHLGEGASRCRLGFTRA